MAEKTTELQLFSLLTTALELEHAAYLQYLSHAEIISGPTSPPISAKLRDNAADEAKHADTLRDLIANYIDSYPTTDIAKTHQATEIPDVLKINIKDETTAIDHYKKTLTFIQDNQGLDNYDTFWESIRQILIEEEQHIAELRILQE